MSAPRPVPYRLDVPDAAITDLRQRLGNTRFPDQAPGEPWSYGTDADYLRELIGYWHRSFDWRAQEARLNAFAQYKVPLHDIELHYLHVPGVGPAPMPLLLLHGWPGSVIEFLEIIPRLTDPPHSRLRVVPGSPPDLAAPILGCAFRPRCDHVRPACGSSAPPLVRQGASEHACVNPAEST